jgi:hypothetical protein
MCQFYRYSLLSTRSEQVGSFAFGQARFLEELCNGGVNRHGGRCICRLQQVQAWRLSLGMLARSPMAPNSFVLVYVALKRAAPHCLLAW